MLWLCPSLGLGWGERQSLEFQWEWGCKEASKGRGKLSSLRSFVWITAGFWVQGSAPSENYIKKSMSSKMNVTIRAVCLVFWVISDVSCKWLCCLRFFFFSPLGYSCHLCHRTSHFEFSLFLVSLISDLSCHQLCSNSLILSSFPTSVLTLIGVFGDFLLKVFLIFLKRNADKQWVSCKKAVLQCDASMLRTEPSSFWQERDAVCKEWYWAVLFLAGNEDDLLKQLFFYLGCF